MLFTKRAVGRECHTLEIDKRESSLKSRLPSLNLRFWIPLKEGLRLRHHTILDLRMWLRFCLVNKWNSDNRDKTRLLSDSAMLSFWQVDNQWLLVSFWQKKKRYVYIRKQKAAVASRPLYGRITRDDDVDGCTRDYTAATAAVHQNLGANPGLFISASWEFVNFV